MRIFILVLLIAIQLSTNVRADIWVVDINGTITLRDDIYPQKTKEMTIYQLVAQKCSMKNNPMQSIEAYIKSQKASKDEQFVTYARLPEYARELLAQDLISQATCDQIPALYAEYVEAHEIANSDRMGEFFPSWFVFVDYILSKDPNPCICFQSFGQEIQMALDKLHEKFGHRINVVTEIAEFDKNETLHFKGKAHKSHDEILALLQPDTIIGIHNYHGGGSKYLFYDDRPGRKVITRYVDDNPYKYLRVYLNGELLEKDAGHDYAGHFIHHVDTGKALTTEDYFVKHQESRQAWLQD